MVFAWTTFLYCDYNLIAFFIWQLILNGDSGGSSMSFCSDFFRFNMMWCISRQTRSSRTNYLGCIRTACCGKADVLKASARIPRGDIWTRILSEFLSFLDWFLRFSISSTLISHLFCLFQLIPREVSLILPDPRAQRRELYAHNSRDVNSACLSSFVAIRANVGCVGRFLRSDSDASCLPSSVAAQVVLRVTAHVFPIRDLTARTPTTRQ